MIDSNLGNYVTGLVVASRRVTYLDRLFDLQNTRTYSNYATRALRSFKTRDGRDVPYFSITPKNIIGLSKSSLAAGQLRATAGGNVK